MAFFVRTKNGDILKCEKLGNRVKYTIVNGEFGGHKGLLNPVLLKGMLKQGYWKILGYSEVSSFMKKFDFFVDDHQNSKY